MTRITLKPGVTLFWAPCMARILEAVRALNLPFPITITSGSDGVHSGPADPHHFGGALDFRTHDLTPEQRREFVDKLRTALGDRFYVLHESPGTPNEHVHVQRRKGTQYTATDYFAG